MSDDITQVLAAVDDRALARIVAVWRGGHAVRDVPVGSSSSWIVGRAAEAELCLDDPSVSRRHAVLHFSHEIRIEDLGSANGTWVNGVKLTPGEVVPLGPGAVVEVGVAALFVRTPTEVGQGAASSGVVSADGIVACDPAMQRVFQLADVVAKSKLTVLILGETGVGKEVLARRIHLASPRAAKKLIALNCAALAESLLESELFGHEKGAFTGAIHTKRGVVESADGGTLFLDEIGELSPGMQAKLLRVIESGTVMRVGASQEVSVDVRFVCATHRDLRAMVREGTFRQDLYFRLEGMTVRIPPLRERPLDLPVLVDKFLTDAARDAERSPPALSAAALERLRRHSWPGNVRELKNVVVRSLLFCDGVELDEGALQFGDSDEVVSTPPPSSVAPPPHAIHSQARAEAAVERRARVLEALQASRWNQTEAARTLGISRRTLYNWMTELGLSKTRV